MPPVDSWRADPRAKDAVEGIVTPSGAQTTVAAATPSQAAATPSQAAASGGMPPVDSWRADPRAKDAVEGKIPTGDTKTTAPASDTTTQATATAPSKTEKPKGPSTEEMRQLLNYSKNQIAAHASNMISPGAGNLALGILSHA
jgi:hypothetical protein